MIPDSAWKFGCGRYIQKAGALNELGNEVLRLGRKPLLICGNRAWQAAGKAALTGIGDLPYEQVLHTAPCCEESALAYAALAQEKICDVIIGLGGGVVLDTAKLAAELAQRPVITVPTISATCAAFAPLSVVYTPDGKTRGTWFYENEINSCIVDMDILGRQPPRYVASGILDSLAKAIEIRHNLLYAEASLDLAFARHSAEYIFQRLAKIAPEIANASKSGTVPSELEEMVYLTIPATGIVSGVSRGRMQSALGHCLYECVRTAFTGEAATTLHGELVGIGLRMQLKYDFGTSESIDPIMHALQSPIRLTDAGIADTEDNLEKLVKTIMDSSYTQGRPYEVKRLQQALREIW